MAYRLFMPRSGLDLSPLADLDLHLRTSGGNSLDPFVRGHLHFAHLALPSVKAALEN